MSLGGMLPAAMGLRVILLPWPRTGADLPAFQMRILPNASMTTEGLIQSPYTHLTLPSSYLTLKVYDRSGSMYF